MEYMDSIIEDYCRDHSSIPSGHCKAIYDHTVANYENSQMLIGPWEAGLLGLLTGICGAERILELGCYTGYSALAMAEHLPENGRLITVDYDEEKGKVARQFWDASPHGHKIELRQGMAIDVIKTLQGPFDLVFIDADKVNYRLYLDQTLPMLPSGGIIVVDNTLWYGTVLDARADDADDIAIRDFNRYVAARKDLFATMLPIRDGVTLIRKA